MLYIQYILDGQKLESKPLIWWVIGTRDPNMLLAGRGIEKSCSGDQSRPLNQVKYRHV